MKKAAVFGLAVVLALSVCACSSAKGSTYTVGDYVVDRKNGTISDGTNVYRYTFTGNASNYRTEITYPDGSTYWWQRQENGSGTMGWSDDYDENRYVDGFALCGMLEAETPARKEAKLGKLVIALLLLAVGAFNIASPRTIWYLSEGWKFKGAEPSDAVLGVTRVGGIACCLTAVIVIAVW